MYRFIESFKLNDGVFTRLSYHQARVNACFDALFKSEKPFDIFEEISRKTLPSKGKFKCRIIYNEKIQSIEIEPYIRREIKSLQLIKVDIESSHFKSENRNNYLEAYNKRGECDDVLMVKDDLITDTSYSNVAFYDGKMWYTPRLPLLFGTQRSELIGTNKIVEADIKTSDLYKFEKISIFNAMIEFGEIELNIQSIRF